MIHRHVAQVYGSLYADRLDDYAAALAQHHAVAGDDSEMGRVCNHGGVVALFELGGVMLEAARTLRAWGRLSQKAGYVPAAREYFERAAAQVGRLSLERELAEARRALGDLSG